MTIKKTAYLPEQVVLAIDLHGVLFRFNYFKLLALLIISGTAVLIINQYGNIWMSLLAGIILISPVLFILLASGYFALSHGYRPIVEHHILSSNHPPVPLIKRSWLWISNFFYPRTSLVALCWELKKTGYELILLSDIGPEAFAILEQRYPKTFYQNQNPLFTHTFYPNSHDSNKMKLTPWYPKNARNFFKKFAKAFIRQNRNIKKIIFIDNNKRNIKRAKQEDGNSFIALHFNNTQQIKKALQPYIIIT